TVKFVPVITTDVPPVVGPVDGESDVIVATPALALVKPLNVVGDVAVPPGVVTTTALLLARLPGVTAVICVIESTVKLVAAVPPNVTAVAPVRFVPVMTTGVPPDFG